MQIGIIGRITVSKAMNHVLGHELDHIILKDALNWGHDNHENWVERGGELSRAGGLNRWSSKTSKQGSTVPCEAVDTTWLTRQPVSR